MIVADEPTAGREGGFDSGNGIVVRNRQIKMNSVALRARFVHLLEPDRRTASGRVHQVGRRSDVVIPEYRLPERAHCGDVHRIDRDCKRLNRMMSRVRDRLVTGRAA
jgi:hypothetical protein